ncbi:ABC transporter substrate-binding protein [Sphingomonas yantingensis]|uniref:ABC-type branched-subunit amino acid transport system substrate-binding protein n=1 Tax=Sphingomonas yantingensis TaxID=1241761 RepID=A0A7W9ASV5_9SPHN|nr:ABC-type branched-subunit amino acid transport system substrate-binding protein [Sphingomonas yantingensis]
MSPVWAAAKVDKRPVALLIPRTGPRAALGTSMERAAMLAENTPGRLIVFDTGGTAAGAQAAAEAAMKRKVAMILGPLLAEEVGPVAGVAGASVPVLAFTNDPGARAPGAFTMGITARQSTGAILRYARSRGVRRVATIADGSRWAVAAAEAAAALQGELNLDVRRIDVAAGQPLPAAGDAPDAVLIPGGGDPVMAAARNLKDTGIQLLGTVQALDHRPASLAVLDGAWLASPDPAAFAAFSQAYESRMGGNAGVIAALAYDAAAISKTLREKNALSRAGLLAEPGFDTATGPLRFREDGSVARDMAIVVAGPEGYAKVATSRGA